MATLDHLVIAAPTLDEGRWLAETLGVEPSPGGRHAGLGTHNALVSLGPDSYLELIARDPDAPAPERPRPFGLDTLDLTTGPRLIHWVARVDDLDHPDAIAMQRGENRWRLTVPADGHLPGGGVEPSLIAWETPRPSTSLPDQGLRLVELALVTPDPDALGDTLSGLGLADERVVVRDGDAVGLRATLERATPGGEKVRIEL
ncbi:VOC family protein [Nigerium massiliense]|uniref:VOC family protein n=1 Tax=Nigerium massiliense TaxID=1522317 RepID=UPI00058C260A|nr:VOC family protein [Nigerium massiliense]